MNRIVDWILSQMRLVDIEDEQEELEQEIRKYIDYVEMYGGDPTHHFARVSVGDKIRGKVLEVGGLWRRISLK